MADSDNLRVRVVTPQLAVAVRALRVTSQQYPYVGDVSFNLTDAAADPHSEAMAILYANPGGGEQVIGFYRLDYRATVVAWKPLCSASVGLRAFMLDRAWQGRGLGAGATAVCCGDLQRRHGERRLLALNVNCRNFAAIRVYRKAGFVDTGEFYFGGNAGPQHLMVRRLGAGAQPPVRSQYPAKAASGESPVH